MKKKNNTYIFIGIIIILMALLAWYLISANKKQPIISSNKTIQQEIMEFSPLKATLEWRDPIAITPYAGRFEPCSDGKNKGKIWMKLTLSDQPEGVYFVCKDEVFIDGVEKSIETFQWNLGSERTKEGWAGTSEELKRKHTVKVCCNSGDKTINICEDFTLEPYC
ncbi:MAG: hypothetical protein WC867_07445 [Candidatus Pacearchaeota archaeon]|jgi:hypothetical protein